MKIEKKRIIVEIFIWFGRQIYEIINVGTAAEKRIFCKSSNNIYLMSILKL